MLPLLPLCLFIFLFTYCYFLKIMNSTSNFKKIINSIDKVVHKRGNGSRKGTDGSVCCVEFKNIVYDNVENSLHLKSTVSTITLGSGSKLIDNVVEYCIQSMNLCEESTFCIQSELMNLKFTATLESCFYKPYIFQMPDCEKLSLAYSFKEQGVQLFKDGKLDECFYKFRRSLQYLMSINIHYCQIEEKYMNESINLEEVMDLMVNVYNNVALIHLNLKHFDLVVSVSTYSIDIKPNIKALFRRGCAFAEKNEYEKAENDLNVALKLDSSNKAVIQKLAMIREKDKNNRDNYKETVKKMFT